MSTPFAPLRSLSTSQTYTLTTDQQDAVGFIASGDSSILIAPTGCGKTAVALHAIAHYLNNGTITRAIVAAPPSVIANWPKEAEKWGLPLNISLLSGPPAQRLKQLHSPADALVISLNNLEWLLQQNHKAQMIVVDELSKAAGQQTAKLKNKSNNKIFIRVGMTATPVSESFEKLYAMCRIIDFGEALGTRKESYLNTYFYPTDFKQYNWALKEGADKLIMEKVRNIIHAIPYSKEEVLPPIERYVVQFPMSPEAVEAYNQMRGDMVLNDFSAVAPNAAVMTGKLRQIASGFVIGEEEIISLDRNRAYALAGLVEAVNKRGESVVVLYEYDYQEQQIKDALQDTPHYTLKGGVDKEPVLEGFKARGKKVLVAQYQTLSHGVDGLQHVCHSMIFYQPIWSRDFTEQAEGRIHRQGQQHPVTITTIVAEGTVDELVVQRVGDKGKYMELFMEHINK